MGYTIYSKPKRFIIDLQYKYQLNVIAGYCEGERKRNTVAVKHLDDWDYFEIRKSFGMLLVIMYAPFNNSRIKWIDWYNRQGYSWTNNTRWNVERYIMMNNRKDQYQGFYNKQQLNLLFP